MAPLVQPIDKEIIIENTYGLLQIGKQSDLYVIVKKPTDSPNVIVKKPTDSPNVIVKHHLYPNVIVKNHLDLYVIVKYNLYVDVNVRFIFTLTLT